MTPWFSLSPAQDVGWKINPTEPVAVIGAGLAGLCIARALSQQGIAVTIYDAKPKIAQGASGSPAGVVKPVVTRQASDTMRFYEAAHQTLHQWLDELGPSTGYENLGVLQRIKDPYPNDNALFQCLDTKDSSTLAGTTIPSEALYFEQAGWLPIHSFCTAIFDDIKNNGVEFIGHHGLQGLSFDHAKKHWQLAFDNQGTRTHRQVILASGAGLAAFPLLSNTNLIPARGQITGFDSTPTPKTVVAGQHYAIPTGDSLWVGASFDRGNASTDIFDADDSENESALRTLLPDLYDEALKVTEHFAGVRCTTLDRFPIVGPVPVFEDAMRVYQDIRHGRHLDDYPSPSFHPGLCVLGGLGSKGIAIAPHIAELLADWIGGGTRLKEDNRLLSPIRFLIRQLKRQES